MQNKLQTKHLNLVFDVYVLCLITKDWGFHGSQQKYRKNNWHIVTDGCLV